MHIHRLEFYINPLKLFEFLNQGEGGGNLVLMQDATEKGYTILARGNEILTEKISDVSRDKLHAVCQNLEAVLNDRKIRLERYLESFKFAAIVAKFPFLSGLLGFFSYDFGLGFENIPSTCTDDRNYPSYRFLIPEEILIWNHGTKSMWAIFFGAQGMELAEDVLKGKIDFFESLRNVHLHSVQSQSCKSRASALNSNLSESEYMEKIAEIKEYLLRGETYQVNFSQRFTFQNSKFPWEIYKAVTGINPVKYQVFLSDTFEGKEFSVISNSPERLFKISPINGRRKIETRPIKGTIGIKGRETLEDLKRLGEVLVRSDKDRAELEMIVDMSRNDLGRVCEFGTVRVDEHRVVEKYSHLLHTVSNVSGVLKNGVKLYDILRAVFPGASITGCPKKRTMEIINRLEEFSRGVYCGSFGYLDCRGYADFNIMIRTLFATPAVTGGYDYTMHSGGGIVMDSDPALELKETYDKVNAFLEAL